MTLRIALLSINAAVGDIQGNAARIRSARATASDAELVVLPELAVCGYPPEDLMLRPAFRAECRAVVAALAEETKSGPALLIGAPWEEHGKVYNAALLLDGGEIAHIHRKVHLPNDGMFDEKRLFTPGLAPEVARFRGRTLGVMVCEDMWHADVPKLLAAQGAEAFIVLNASPYERGKPARRREAARAIVEATGAPLHYVNLDGAQDDIVFDGDCFVMERGDVAHVRGDEAEVWRALTVGLGDYVRKNGFPGVLLGLSGGVDSALAAAIAVDALGAESVTGVLLPSPFSSDHSVEDALESARLLGIETLTVPITAMREAAHVALREVVPEAKLYALAVDGNLQARLRGLTLMALSNATGRMLLSTANKSEAAVGYTTLYGDSCGGYAPLKDVYKTEIYDLARWRNARSPAIPVSSLDKAPSAELAPGQKDEDQLPSYPVLDAVLRAYIEEGRSAVEIIAQGQRRETVERILGMVRASEFKRRQMPPGARISPMMFGRDWRYPLTNKWKG